ncbi:2-dehydro-3-deoxygalactonokinase [Profundibacter sp.]|uniref:2-dehydro-3-deoxygalactonokinase n=1 Tax=Profundibacter sp. TaxID=3101071 RepID=UPI003D1465B3
MSDKTPPEWIAVDWGTSNLRAWAVAGDGSIQGSAQSDWGMGRLKPSGFEDALLDVIGDWLDPASQTDVLCCGMVGARQGWIEAPYRPVPAPVVGRVPPVQAPARDPRIRVFILPGLKQDDPADVMRGEETQIAGFLSQSPDFDGVVCLPGTHSKWVRISAGEVVGFTTFMTGELFALLAGHSVLCHSVGAGGFDEQAFDNAVTTGTGFPAQVAGELFRLRAEDLLKGLPAGQARARLSGLLIGQEIAAARGWWLGMRLVILGGAKLAGIYLRALKAQGAQCEPVAGEDATLDGLKAVYGALTKEGQT